MRKLVAAILVAGAFCFALASSVFDEGWAAGYKAGHCYQKIGCIEPIVPTAPIPHGAQDSWQDGYNRGFLAGLASK